MSRRGPTDGHLWPSVEQELLLAAALRDGEAATGAYRVWRARVDVDAEFGWDALRLMPLVYRNLHALGVDDPLVGRLKGVYRRAWYETHRLFQHTRPAVAALRAAGLDLLLLKGAPLALAYYRNHALRPMSDLDVCVRPLGARAAVRVLVEQGWRPTREITDDHFRFFHALQLKHPSGGELDLHWHVAYETSGTDRDALFWADTEPLDFLGLAVRQLRPTPLLLQTVLHGMRWNEETPVRWIPDALRVLAERGADVDWDRFVDLARRLQVTYRLGLGLGYLAERFGAPVPAGALAALRAARPSLPERIEATVILRDTARVERTMPGNQWSILADFTRVVDPGRRPVSFVATYPHYLRYRLGLDGRRDLLPMVLRGAGRRLRPRAAARKA